MTSEFELIAGFEALHRAVHPGVLRGIGDDCAVLTAGDATLLWTVDAFVEEVHFRRAFAPPRILGSRAAAAAISDIAAMGGEAIALLVTAALGPAWSADDARELAAGIDARARAAGAVVVGGDTTRSPGPLFLDITVMGRVPAGSRAVPRTGALAGDVLAVTGYPGESGLGLLHLIGDLDLDAAEAARVVARHLDPTPRLSEGRLLASLPGVHAMIDVSDGLGQDAGHLARAAGLLLRLDPGLLPCSEALRDLRARSAAAWQAQALAGGEDYELAAAIAPGDAGEAARLLALRTGTPLTVVGRFIAPGPDGPGVVLPDGTRAGAMGWDPFRT